MYNRRETTVNPAAWSRSRIAQNAVAVRAAGSDPAASRMSARGTAGDLQGLSYY
jgi:hypothetical protein